MNLKSLLPTSRTRSVARGKKLRFCRCNERSIACSRTSHAASRASRPPFQATGAVDLMPSMDVTETDKEIEITAELPGLEEKDVQINLSDNLLTIRGEKKAEKEQKEKDYRLVERSYGSFSRTLELPDGVDPQSDHRQGRAQDDSAETGAGPGEEDRR
jgi:HSP20 family protein